MNKTRLHSARQGKGSDRGRSSIVVPTIMVAFAILAAAGLYRYFRSSAPAPADHAEAGATPTDELEAARVETPAAPLAAPRNAVTIRKHLPSPSTEPAAILNGAASTGPAVSADAQQAVARLAQLDLRNPLSAEQAAAVKGDLQRLVAQGNAAVPAIQEFLTQNRDLSLDEIKSNSPVGYSSLRAGMFDALRQIGGSAAQQTLADTLRTTADPGEIALLARHLEDMAPGEYRNETLQAARETLAQMTETRAQADAGPLFQVLQTYGNGTVAADLQKAATTWEHYGLMALAGLPDGQGIPVLIQQAQQGSAGGSAKNIFALQMLAQVAPQFPEATAALLEQARAGGIPDRAWGRIADALAGDQYQFAREGNADAASLLRTPGTKTYHINNNNENFYSLPLASAPEADLSQRQALIDQLLAANNNNAAAVQALEKARAALIEARR